MELNYLYKVSKVFFIERLLNVYWQEFFFFSIECQKLLEKMLKQPYVIGIKKNCIQHFLRGKNSTRAIQ